VDKTELQRDEFSQELKRIRESKGLRLEEMAHRYKLRPSFLESIESGSFEDLPEPVYTKTFIKTYAGLLGVDAGPILARYAKYVEKTMPAPPPEAPKEQVREARAENAVFDRLGSMGGRLGWAVFALVVIVILGIYVFQDSGERPVQVKTTAREAVKPPEKLPETPPVEAPQAPAGQQPDAALQQQAAVQTAVPQATPTQTAAPEQKKPEAPPPAEKKEPPAPSAAGALNLTIEATEAAWVQVKADKTPAVQKLMQAGEKLTTEAKERITVDLGNAGGVQITFQGQSLGSPGKRGEVIHLVYPEGKRTEKKKPQEMEPVTKPATE
jgi:cytoskeleton protein RodZ